MFDLPLCISFKTPEILAKRPQHFQIVGMFWGKIKPEIPAIARGLG
jgi:hypothetical protein